MVRVGPTWTKLFFVLLSLLVTTHQQELFEDSVDLENAVPDFETSFVSPVEEYDIPDDGAIRQEQSLEKAPFNNDQEEEGSAGEITLDQPVPQFKNNDDDGAAQQSAKADEQPSTDATESAENSQDEEVATNASGMPSLKGEGGALTKVADGPTGEVGNESQTKGSSLKDDLLYPLKDESADRRHSIAGKRNVESFSKKGKVLRKATKPGIILEVKSKGTLSVSNTAKVTGTNYKPKARQVEKDVAKQSVKKAGSVKISKAANVGSTNNTIGQMLNMTTTAGQKQADRKKRQLNQDDKVAQAKAKLQHAEKASDVLTSMEKEMGLDPSTAEEKTKNLTSVLKDEMSKFKDLINKQDDSVKKEKFEKLEKLAEEDVKGTNDVMKLIVELEVAKYFAKQRARQKLELAVRDRINNPPSRPYASQFADAPPVSPYGPMMGYMPQYQHQYNMPYSPQMPLVTQPPQPYLDLPPANPQNMEFNDAMPPQTEQPPPPPPPSQPPPQQFIPSPQFPEQALQFTNQPAAPVMNAPFADMSHPSAPYFNSFQARPMPQYNMYRYGGQITPNPNPMMQQQPLQYGPAPNKYRPAPQPYRPAPEPYRPAPFRPAQVKKVHAKTASVHAKVKTRPAKYYSKPVKSHDKPAKSSRKPAKAYKTKAAKRLNYHPIKPPVMPEPEPYIPNVMQAQPTYYAAYMQNGFKASPGFGWYDEYSRPQPAQQYSSQGLPPQAPQQYSWQGPPPQAAKQYYSQEPPPQAAQQYSSQGPPPQAAEQYSSQEPPPQAAQQYFSQGLPPQEAQQYNSKELLPQAAQYYSQSSPAAQLSQPAESKVPDIYHGDFVENKRPPPLDLKKMMHTLFQLHSNPALFQQRLNAAYKPVASKPVEVETKPAEPEHAAYKPDEPEQAFFTPESASQMNAQFNDQPNLAPYEPFARPQQPPAPMPPQQQLPYQPPAPTMQQPQLQAFAPFSPQPSQPYINPDAFHNTSPFTPEDTSKGDDEQYHDQPAAVPPPFSSQFAAPWPPMQPYGSYDMWGRFAMSGPQQQQQQALAWQQDQYGPQRVNYQMLDPLLIQALTKVKNTQKAAEVVKKIEDKIGLSPPSVNHIIDDVETETKKERDQTDQAIRDEEAVLEKQAKALNDGSNSTKTSSQDLEKKKMKLEEDRKRNEIAKQKLASIRKIEKILTFIETARWSAIKRAKEHVKSLQKGGLEIKKRDLHESENEIEKRRRRNNINIWLKGSRNSINTSRFFEGARKRNKNSTHASTWPNSFKDDSNSEGSASRSSPTPTGSSVIKRNHIAKKSKIGVLLLKKLLQRVDNLYDMQSKILTQLIKNNGNKRRKRSALRHHHRHRHRHHQRK
ncbi:proteoglycan 4 [Nematostella vectensis]|uniref:proteoglycan 4 n=1 Tax=Nematostella vectensis TaxID=45351 RepID=UPI002076F7FD|nr:proteoglycan 4 [Nematostella vectensis]XP_048585297.1 proteoglycan 4 [Nematostella vectensis]XP_048585298.1 proteoglycan 4 [Nematostella vectensis]